MKITGKIEIFKNKKGYYVGVIKSFSEDKKVVGKEMINVRLDESYFKKSVPLLAKGKTVTIEVTEGYLNLKHIELESESFNKIVLDIKKGKFVSAFPEDEKVTDTKKKSETKSSKKSTK